MKIRHAAMHLPTGPPVAMFGNAETKHGPRGAAVSHHILRIHIKPSCDMRVKCHKCRYDKAS
jgi:hypothetical protein